MELGLILLVIVPPPTNWLVYTTLNDLDTTSFCFFGGGLLRASSGETRIEDCEFPALPRSRPADIAAFKLFGVNSECYGIYPPDLGISVFYGG